MTIPWKRGVGGALLIATAVEGSARAQSVDIGEILVTPNRFPTERGQVGSSVSVITEEEIEAQEKPAVTDYLTLLPGVHAAPVGGAGQETSLSIRGADKKYVKTLFNGIDISDPSATQVQVPFEHLLAGGISGIEVVKGSQSTLYGADAVAGVMQISTLGDLEPGLSHELRLEGGSFQSARAGYQVGLAGDAGRGSLGLHGFTTGGISAADEDNGNAEEDTYQNLTGTIVGELDLGDGFGLFGSGLFIESEADFDDAGNPPTDNLFNETEVRQLGGRIGGRADLFGGRFQNQVSAQVFDIDRELLLVSMFGPFVAEFEGRRTKLDYQGAVEVIEPVVLTFGADHEHQRAEVDDNFGTATDDHYTITGFWTQALVEPVENLSLTAGVRHDDHSVFDGYTTYRATASYLVGATGTRPHASFGTGFRSPSLFELFAPFGTGNPELQPEESTSFDIGVEQTLLDGDLRADVTFFLLDTEDLIDFSFASSRFEQFRGTTRRRGVEAAVEWQPTDWLGLAGAYTYTDVEEESGDRRPRIPRHDVALRATVRPAENWQLSATAHAVFDTDDRVSAFAPPFFETVELDDYVKLDAKVAWRPRDNFELYLRGENLLDQDYQLVEGFGTPGLSVFAGVRAEF